MCALAAAVLVTAPACGRETALRQPEPVVRVVHEPLPAAPSPAPVKQVKPLLPPAPLPPEEPASGTAVAVKEYIRRIFGPHGLLAVRVASCETGGTFNPLARGRVGERGVFQIRPEFHSWRIAKVGGSTLWSYKTNVRVAYHLFREQGWRPWTCARRLGIR